MKYNIFYKLLIVQEARNVERGHMDKLDRNGK